MSTSIVISNPRPNHLPVKVFVQQKNKEAEWPSQTEYTLKVGEAASEYVCRGRRIIIEEIIE